MRELETLVRAVQAMSDTFELAVIGGISLGVWTEPRNTSDVDILVDSTDYAAIEAAGFKQGLTTNPTELEHLRKAGMTRLRLPELPEGRVRIDVITVDHPFYERVVRRAVRAPLYGAYVPVATAEDVIVLKCLADRGQDRLDVASIVESQGDNLDRGLVERECRAIGIEPPW